MSVKQRWNPPPDVAIAYIVPTAEGMRVWVRGMRIGHLAVRAKWNGEQNGDGTGVRGFIVDHIPTGAFLFDCDDIATAVRFADDLSRFSLHDLGTRDENELARRFGRRVLMWFEFVDSASRAGDPMPSYRDFLRARRAALVLQGKARPRSDAN